MGWLDSLFGGGKDPSKEANKYLDQIPGILDKYYSPYIGQGQGAYPKLQEQYGNLMNDPGGFLNKLGEGYKQSPGFQRSMQDALTGSAHAQAAGGMAGTPQHERMNMELASDLSSRDYNDWISKALGLYGTGLGGEQGFYNTGANFSRGMGQDLASVLAQQAGLQYNGQTAQNQRSGGMFGGLLGGGIGLLAGGGNPLAAFYGMNMGNKMFGA